MTPTEVYYLSLKWLEKQKITLTDTSERQAFFMAARKEIVSGREDLDYALFEVLAKAVRGIE